MQKVINNKTDKIWNPLFTTIFIANACMNLSQQMMNSLVSKYADYLGAAATVVGIVASIYSVTALIFKILSGPVIDTYNRRFVLSGTMLIMAVSFFWIWNIRKRSDTDRSASFAGSRAGIHLYLLPCIGGRYTSERKIRVGYRCFFHGSGSQSGNRPYHRPGSGRGYGIPGNIYDWMRDYGICRLPGHKGEGTLCKREKIKNIRKKYCCQRGDHACIYHLSYVPDLFCN